MKLCEYDCKPNCDFCIYCRHRRLWMNLKLGFVNGSPKKCVQPKHKKDFKSKGYCEDFHCFNVKE